MRTIYSYVIDPATCNSFKSSAQEFFKTGWHLTSKTSLKELLDENENKWDSFVCSLSKTKQIKLHIIRVFPSWILRLEIDKKPKGLELIQKRLQKNLAAYPLTRYRIFESKGKPSILERENGYINLPTNPSKGLLMSLDSLFFDLFMSDRAVEMAARKWNDGFENFKEVYKIKEGLNLSDFKPPEDLIRKVERLSFEIVGFREILDFSKHATEITFDDISLTLSTLDRGLDVFMYMKTQSKKNIMLVMEIEAEFKKISTTFSFIRDAIEFKLNNYNINKGDKTNNFLVIVGIIIVLLLILNILITMLSVIKI